MEFAVIAPLFFLLIFGMIEYGRMVMVQQMMTNASREGARQAVLDGSTAQDVETTVNNYLVSGNIQSATITVNPADLSSASSGDPITVSVQIPYSQVSWLPVPKYLSNSTLSANSVMRRETVD